MEAGRDPGYSFRLEDSLSALFCLNEERVVRTDGRVCLARREWLGKALLRRLLERADGTVTDETG